MLGVGAPIAAAALVVVALVAVIGSAQAAPSTKIYEATVYMADASSLSSTSAKLTLTLKNDSKSKQTLGSANFVAPTGMLPAVPQGNIAPGVDRDRRREHRQAPFDVQPADTGVERLGRRDVQSRGERSVY